MPAPTAEQAHRASTLGAWFVNHLPGLFEFTDADRQRYHPVIASPGPETAALRDRLVARTQAALVERFGEPHLSSALVDFLCFPVATGLAVEYDPTTSHTERTWRENLHIIGCMVAERHVSAQPTPYMVAVISARLEYMLTHVLDDTERKVYSHDVSQAYFGATSRECVQLLFTATAEPEARATLQNLVLGAWNMPVEIPGTANMSPRPETSYQAHSGALWPRTDDFHALLEQDGRLDYDAFCRVAEICWPERPMLPRLLLSKPESSALTPLERKLREFGTRYIRTLARDPGSTGNTCWSPFGTPLCGIEWLEAACEHVEREGMTRVAADTYGDLPYMIRGLTNVASLETGESRADLVARLRRFSPRTLEAVVPHVRRFSADVLEARGWTALQPLDGLVRRLAEQSHSGSRDIPNGGGDLSGVVDRAEIVACVEAAGEPLARQYIAVLRASKIAVTHTLVLVEAALGWNAAEVVSGLDRDRQIAIKAYGLLPLGNADETMERYRALREIARGARQYGVERSQNTRSAVDVALANLAQTAGFADRLRLEWAMEARLAGGTRQRAGSRRVQDWELELVVDDPPRIVVRRAGRALKAIPAAVRKSDEYAELKEALTSWKTQASRVRAAFERMMVDGDELTTADLERVASMPVAEAMLSTLVVRTSDGTYGLYRGDGAVEALDGRRWQTPALAIAHPRHLAEAGSLREWQHAIVHRRVVQPFKQVFRELYVLAPGEAEAGASNRFAGHRIEPRRATGLMQARSWRLGSGSVAEPYKHFAAADVHAYFGFADAGHYLAETEHVTSGAIRFVHQHRPMQLGQVNPLIVSEVFRDADLVVSAAALAGGAAWSLEAAERRADVARAVCGEFPIANVEFEGTYALIAGHHANYRVHLGSGVVHVAGSTHVCTVSPGQLAGLTSPFLPFPPDEDVKTAEVVSLILLFANDRRITDAGILSQISRDAAADQRGS